MHRAEILARLVSQRQPEVEPRISLRIPSEPKPIRIPVPGHKGRIPAFDAVRLAEAVQMTLTGRAKEPAVAVEARVAAHFQIHPRVLRKYMSGRVPDGRGTLSAAQIAEMIQMVKRGVKPGQYCAVQHRIAKRFGVTYYTLRKKVSGRIPDGRTVRAR